MRKELIISLNKSFEDYAHQEGGIEFWFVRDLQKLLGYVEWRKFLGVIERAKEACQNSNNNITGHFVEAARMVILDSEAVSEELSS